MSEELHLPPKFQPPGSSHNNKNTVSVGGDWMIPEINQRTAWTICSLTGIHESCFIEPVKNYHYYLSTVRRWDEHARGTNTGRISAPICSPDRFSSVLLTFDTRWSTITLFIWTAKRHWHKGIVSQRQMSLDGAWEIISWTTYPPPTNNRRVVRFCMLYLKAADVTRVGNVHFATASGVRADQ